MPMFPRTPDAEGPPPDPPDEVLVQRAQAGDTAAFDELVSRHALRIRGMVYHMTGHREDTEDIVQAAWVRAYRALKRFRGQSAFYTWLYRIAMNLTLNHLKRRRRRAGELSLDDLEGTVERHPDLMDLAARHTPARDAQLSDLQRRIHEALGTLGEKHRAVVVLHDIQGLPHEAIGKALGIPTATVRTRLFYARRRLQDELREFIE
jgi:RNA polymerase sigma factor (sigma-70 family)